MADERARRGGRPGWVDHAVSALSAWLGDHLARTDNELHQPLAFFVDNRSVEPEALPPPARGKICVLVHGLGCNEGLWTFPRPHPEDDYGRLLEATFGHSPLYVRYNTGLRISENGRALADRLQRHFERHDTAIREIVLIGHSMGGLVIRSACHAGAQKDQAWVRRVRHAFYLGSPHLGAPLEKLTNVASNVLGVFDTTATQVIRDLLDTRAGGIKDLRFGNLVDEDWLAHQPDALLDDRRVAVPWLASARHHRVLGEAMPGAAALVGDALVRPDSAAARAYGVQPAAPGEADLHLAPRLDHFALARHPSVYAYIERVLRETDGDRGDV